MLTVRYQDITFDMPTALPELTLGQYMRFVASTTNRQALEAVASDRDQLARLPAGAEPKLINKLSFLTSLPDLSALPVPKMIGGIVPPEAPNLCPLAQKWAFEDWIKEGEDSTMLDLTVPILAVYLYPALTGDTFTDIIQAKAIRGRIEALPAMEALPLAAFFLSSYDQPMNSGLLSLSETYPEAPPSWWRSIWSRILSPISSLRSYRLSLNTGA